MIGRKNSSKKKGTLVFLLLSGIIHSKHETELCFACLNAVPVGVTSEQSFIEMSYGLYAWWRKVQICKNKGCVHMYSSWSGQLEVKPAGNFIPRTSGLYAVQLSALIYAVQLMH